MCLCRTGGWRRGITFRDEHWTCDELHTLDIPSKLPDHLAGGADAPLVLLPGDPLVPPSLAFKSILEAKGAATAAFYATIARLPPFKPVPWNQNRTKSVRVNYAVSGINLLICQQ